MAVQAQQQCGLFSPEFAAAGRFSSRIPASHGGLPLFSGGDQGSELTCNLSASRKRPREEQELGLQQQLWLAGKIPPDDCTRLRDSALSSTSGRSGSSPPAANPLVREFLSQLNQQRLEVDNLIRLQNDRLRKGIEEARKRHCRALILAMEEAVVRRLREKEAELESVTRRNAELEEKVWQMTAENQMWFSVARNNEAIVAGLRASLEQALQSAGGAAAAPPPPAAVEEGFGDSDCVALPAGFQAEDEQSCCNGPEPVKELSKTRVCRVCEEEEVSVLLLPCRHLCLCKKCEARLDACPICSAAKNASLQIFLS
ncbi:putative BOI-related E3 ubiquitin-protein ligase 3 [Wolffia australiana]